MIAVNRPRMKYQFKKHFVRGQGITKNMLEHGFCTGCKVGAFLSRRTDIDVLVQIMNSIAVGVGAFPTGFNEQAYNSQQVFRYSGGFWGSDGHPSIC